MSAATVGLGCDCCRADGRPSLRTDWMYNKIFESLWPGRGLMPTVCKVLASNGISDPLFFFPTFYTMREVPTPLRATPTRVPSLCPWVWPVAVPGGSV